MHELERATIKKIYRRFIPLLLVCFIIAFLDRVNVGFAALTMSKDLGFSATAFGLGAGMFFISYFLMEVPSNIILQKVGARLWIARIMITWGVLSAAMAFVQGEKSFYLVRILLGAAEAGFFPGVILFLTYWIPRSYRGHVVSSFMVAMPLASVIGAPVSSWLLGFDGILGLKGWQFMYIVEAVPAVLLAFVVLVVLRDTPEKTEWLTAEERTWLLGTLERERQEAAPTGGHGFVEIIRNPRILQLSLVYFGIVGFNFGLSFFLPQIMREFQFTLLQTGLLSAVPFAVAAVGMIWWGRRSDARNERRFHLIFPMACAAVGLGGSTFMSDPTFKLGFLCLSAFGVFSALPIFWTMTSSLLSAAASAVALAVINSLGNLSGFAAPYAVGAVKDLTGSFNGGLQMIAVYGIFAICLMLYILSGQPRAATAGRETIQATGRP